MSFDPNRTDYAPNQQAALDAWRPTRGTLDSKVSSGNLSAASRDLVLAFVAIDPLDAAAVTAQLTAVEAAITETMAGRQALDPVIVGLQGTLAAMATALGT